MLWQSNNNSSSGAGGSVFGSQSGGAIDDLIRYAPSNMTDVGTSTNNNHSSTKNITDNSSSSSSQQHRPRSQSNSNLLLQQQQQQQQPPQHPSTPVRQPPHQRSQGLGLGLGLGLGYSNNNNNNNSSSSIGQRGHSSTVSLGHEGYHSMAGGQGQGPGLGLGLATGIGLGPGFLGPAYLSSPNSPYHQSNHQSARSVEYNHLGGHHSPLFGELGGMAGLGGGSSGHPTPLPLLRQHSFTNNYSFQVHR